MQNTPSAVHPQLLLVSLQELASMFSQQMEPEESERITR